MMKIISRNKVYSNKNFLNINRILFSSFSTIKNDSTNSTKSIKFTFINLSNNQKTSVIANKGENLFKTARNNNVKVKAVCDGLLSCGTCHMYLENDLYDKIIDHYEVEEEELLERSVGLTDTSRLGCQTIITEDFEGTVIEIPDHLESYNCDKDRFGNEIINDK